MIQLPIISISPYLPQTSSEYTVADRAQTAQALHEACRDVGFFYLKVDDYLNKEEMDRVLNLGREFFQRPQEEKDEIAIEKSDRVRGYQKLERNITLGKADYQEGLDFYAPSPYPPSTGVGGGEVKPKLRPLEGPNLWPEYPVSFRPTLEIWMEKMKVLGMAIMRAMADGLGMSDEEWKSLRGMIDNSFWVMRVIGYPPLPDGAEGISCGSHKDYGCLTLLHADPVPEALQVLPAAPNSSTQSEWINADPKPGCIVVNIGSMWEIWTGGLYPATIHRVIHQAQIHRISVPFFFEPNFDTRVRVLDAARRVAKREGKEIQEKEEVVYGDFLLKKVTANFRY